MQTNDRTGEKEIQGQETTKNSSYSINGCKKKCTKPKENAYIFFKGLTYEVNENERERDGGDGHRQFKTSKINSKRAIETYVVYVYTKANTKIHSHIKKRKFQCEIFVRLSGSKLSRQPIIACTSGSQKRGRGQRQKIYTNSDLHFVNLSEQNRENFTVEISFIL